MESVFDELNRYQIGLIVAFILAIVAYVIYLTVVTRKSNFECRFKTSDGRCMSANCPPGEYWNVGSQKCEKWGSGTSWSNNSECSPIRMSHIEYANCMKNKRGKDHDWMQLSPEDLQRRAQYGSQMFNNLPDGVSPPPKTY